MEMDNWLNNNVPQNGMNNIPPPIIPFNQPVTPVTPPKIQKEPNYDPSKLLTGIQAIERSYVQTISKLSEMVHRLGDDGEQTRKVLERSEKIQVSMQSLTEKLSKDKVVNLSRELGKLGVDKESKQIILNLNRQNQQIVKQLTDNAINVKTMESKGELTPQLKREYDLSQSKLSQQQKELIERMDAFMKASIGKVQLTPEEETQYREEMVKLRKDDLSASMKRDAVIEKMTGYLDKLEQKKDDIGTDEYLNLQKKIFQSMSNIETAQSSNDIKNEMDKLHKMLDPTINIENQKKMLAEQFMNADKISDSVKDLQEKLVDIEKEKKDSQIIIEKAKAEKDLKRQLIEEQHYKKLEEEEKQQNKILTNMVDRQKLEERKKKADEKNKPPFFKTLTSSIGSKGADAQVGDIAGDVFKAFGLDKKLKNFLTGEDGKDDGGGILGKGKQLLTDSIFKKGGKGGVGNTIKGLFGKGAGTAVTGAGTVAAGGAGTALTGAGTAAGLGGAATTAGTATAVGGAGTVAAGGAGTAAAGGAGALLLPALAIAGAGLAGAGAGYGIFKKVVEPMMDKDQQKATQAEQDYSDQRQSQVDTVLSKKKEEMSKSGKTMTESDKWDTVLSKTAAGKQLGTSMEGDTKADKDFQKFLRTDEGKDFILEKAKTNSYKDKDGKSKVKIGAFDFDVAKIEEAKKKVEEKKEKEKEQKAEMKKPAENVFVPPPQSDKTTFIAVPVKDRIKAFERLF